MEEIWKDIEGWENYQVSNLGSVRSKDRYVTQRTKNGKIVNVFKKGVIIKGFVTDVGYANVTLGKGVEGSKHFARHRLVAEAFIPNPDNKPQVNHIDGNKLNNAVTNLEWCTMEENIQHGWKHGLYKMTDQLQSNLDKGIEARKHKVAQIDKDTGEVIKIHESCRDAVREMTNGANTNCSNITAVCKGRRNLAYGYKWKLIDE